MSEGEAPTCNGHRAEVHGVCVWCVMCVFMVVVRVDGLVGGHASRRFVAAAMVL